MGDGGRFMRGSKKPTEIQKKVSAAIANSLNAINKFKCGKANAG